MKDKQFKTSNHFCEGYSIFSNGKSIHKNYTPDFVLKRDNEYVILEHENEPNRKTILANIFKAAVFLQNEKSGILIIVITPKRKSSFESYIHHSKDYFKWLKEKSNLEAVCFIKMDDYCQNNKVIEINGKLFVDKTVKLK